MKKIYTIDTKENFKKMKLNDFNKVLNAVVEEVKTLVDNINN